MTRTNQPDLHEKQHPRVDDAAGTESAPGGASAETAAGGGVERLQAELAAAQAQAKDSEDKFLRAKAETENIRRRAQIDVANAHKFGVERLMTELLPVRDSLELAKNVDLSQAPSVAQKMQEGLELTLRMMDSVFQKVGVSVVDPQGQKFDPTHQQAVSMIESDQVPPNHVIQVMQKGYLLNDRLLRPAMVVVSKPKEA